MSKSIDTNAIELKPCPFCGGDVHYSNGDDCHIICLNQGCNLFDITLRASFSGNFSELAKQWNTRNGFYIEPKDAAAQCVGND